MKIKIAEPRHLQQIPELIKACILDMESKDIYQWNDYYPTLDYFEDDINKGNMRVIESNDELIGIITFNEFQDDEYKDVRWLTATGNNLVIHRLAVNPKWQRKGVARFLMDYAEDYAFKKGYASIRLDAFSDNKRVLRFYRNRGYIKTGQVYFPKRETPFFTYEKLLT
jgi:ribosomal protein S18 acetylase RimI-like enzyme